MEPDARESLDVDTSGSAPSDFGGVPTVGLSVRLITGNISRTADIYSV